MSSSLILAAATSVVMTYYVLKVSSPWLMIPIYLAVFLAWSGYRIIIYQRYLNLLSRLPGPKVSASCYNDNFRDIGFGESFQHSSMKNLDNHISDGSANIAILPDSSHFLDYSIPVK